VSQPGRISAVAPSGSRHYFVFRPERVTFRNRWFLPDTSPESWRLEIDEEGDYSDLVRDVDRYYGTKSGWDGDHRILAYPWPLQGGDVQADAYRASRHTNRYIPDAEFRAHVPEMLCLFQFASDSSLYWLSGTVYFWINRNELLARNFANVVTFLETT
jgi:hypothetical protein